MKVLVLGASGIIGQHMRLCVPDGFEPVWYRREADALHKGADLSDEGLVHDVLMTEQPAVVINLAGESRVDIVERDPQAYTRLNVGLPQQIAAWASERDAKYVHISTQACYVEPVNEYGRQKKTAEDAVPTNPPAVADATVAEYRSILYIGPTGACLDQGTLYAIKFFLLLAFHKECSPGDL